MENKNIITMLVLLVFFAVSAAGCAQKIEKQTSQETEEIGDTGILFVESTPSLAQVYIDGEFKGSTPFTIYNVPVGSYTLLAKKEGYKDFQKTVAIRVGRTEEINVELIQLKLETEKPVEDKETKKTSQEPANESQPENESAENHKFSKINLSSFAMYYDFDKMEFTQLRTDKSDLFSRKYDSYLHFTALTPAQINAIDKPIREAQKEDCIFTDVAVMQLFSGQTLCVKTAEGNVAALGFTSLDELEYTLFS